MAKAIGDNLQDAGFKGADVSPADAAPATVEISQEPVVQANQPIGGASFEQAQTDDFQVMHTLSFSSSFSFITTHCTPPSFRRVPTRVINTLSSPLISSYSHPILPILLSYQDAFRAAVAVQLSVDLKDVQVTDVVVDDHGAVTMSYQVVGVDPLEQIATSNSVQSMGMADNIAQNLQKVETY